MKKTTSSETISRTKAHYPTIRYRTRIRYSFFFFILPQPSQQFTSFFIKKRRMKLLITSLSLSRTNVPLPLTRKHIMKRRLEKKRAAGSVGWKGWRRSLVALSFSLEEELNITPARERSFHSVLTNYRLIKGPIHPVVGGTRERFSFRSKHRLIKFSKFSGYRVARARINYELDFSRR